MASHQGLRADAERNRETLLESAEVVFAAEGPRAPLALVTDHSGLGRGTLYRHFPNRAALVAAIYDRRLDRYEVLVRDSQNDGQALFQALDAIAWDQFSIPDLLQVIRDDEGSAQVYERMWLRIESLVADLLEDAHRAKTVRPDITVQDVILVISMLYGVVNSPSASRWGTEAVTRAQALVRRLLTP